MDKCLHSRGTFLLHFICFMTVDIQSKRCCCVAQVVPDSFEIIAGAQGCHCIGMMEMLMARGVAAYLKTTRAGEEDGPKRRTGGFESGERVPCYAGSFGGA